MLELAAGGRDCGFLVRVHVRGAAEARVQLHTQLAGALGHQHLRSRRGHVTCFMSHVITVSHSYHIVTVIAAVISQSSRYAILGYCWLALVSPAPGDVTW